MDEEPLDMDREEMMESAEEFEAAYEAHAAPIYRFLYWRTRDAALSEDLTSSVFEKAWRSRSSFHGGSRRAWLQRIARNLLIDHWRRQKPLYSDDIESLPEAETTPDASADVDRALMITRLRQAVDELPPRMRQVVQLRFIEGMSARQTGRRLEISENNVRIIQYRALKKLRVIIDEKE